MVIDSIPVSETEFARDNVFAYHTSVLRDYIKEKGANPDDYEIVNAQGYDELRAFAEHLTLDNIPQNTSIVIRSSSSLPKAISGIADIPSQSQHPKTSRWGASWWESCKKNDPTTRKSLASRRHLCH